MLALKLSLVPFFLLVITLVGKYYGPAIAGWIAGLPVVAGPILYFIALENGAQFAATSAAAAAAAVFASMAFSISYARLALRHPWYLALPASLLVWLVAASVLSVLPGVGLPPAVLGGLVGTLALLLAPKLFPALPALTVARQPPWFELLLRMTAGAILTLAVTLLAHRLGAQWSGLLAVFPVMSSVLAVFSQRSMGPAFAAALLRSMATGMASFVVFCVTVASLLEHTSTSAAFVLAVFACLVVQLISKRWVK
jgi:uncharacterized membrane protein (GlpM family)